MWPIPIIPVLVMFRTGLEFLDWVLIDNSIIRDHHRAGSFISDGYVFDEAECFLIDSYSYIPFGA